MSKNPTVRGERNQREKRASANRTMGLSISVASPMVTSQLTLLLWLFVLAQAAVAQVHHTSNSETDRFLLCARSAFQKPVYITVMGPWFDAAMRCLSDRKEILHELEERQVAVFENESAILLVPPRLRPDIKWQKFDVKLHILNFDDPVPPGSVRSAGRSRSRSPKSYLKRRLYLRLVSRTWLAIPER